ncbi:hypothetical protein TPHA_0A03860 [Tetrapisispora phaffii CBS 4417]|uniref:SAGA complex subunit Spt7 n=1 Tax=Tetrapisispora phaffii (strain ATCC 24235 / CBS 4417 / NBRC 1672 / NRRL Y-8282 / UCD 70-5) TaxID=1071381 RepID=G8BNI4_TETPH|nr:hypothetical protein TPHA_0A03860 [Tetrapisispora phaffii CBS 4417]CCE61462.1 hypothetical protein TPHA_0A03860 [Tetrapisispora phaffii CBS 4417]
MVEMLEKEVAIVNYQKTNPKTLLKLTEKLNEERYFDAYLTPNQLIILENFLTIDDKDKKLQIWYALLDANIKLNVETVDEKERNEQESGKPFAKIDENINTEVRESQDIAHNNNADENTPNSDSMESEDLSKLDLEEFTQQIQGPEFIGNFSLKLRYVLWQCAVDLLYNRSSDFEDEQNDDDKDLLDYVLLENDDSIDEKNDAMPPNNLTFHNGITSNKDSRENYDEDSDYDFDAGDVDSKSSKPNDNDNDTIEDKVSDITVEFNEKGVLEINMKVSRSFFKNIRTNNIEKIIQNWDKIYHSFEYDQDTMLKRLRLEENDKLLENSKDKKRSHEDMVNDSDNTKSIKENEHQIVNGENNSNDDDKDINSRNDSKKPRQDSLNIPVSLSSANLSLKYLMASIQENKSKLNISDYELKHLITDVKKNRSKWSSDERIGQEELYEACEKVVIELRNLTEHSTPFLNKVSKREAPNYHQVIKKSMDLNTVLKKLKGFQYNSKQEFVDDIMLIWKNCLTYNSDPSHFLRRHAIAMQKKSLQLLPLIPDITIRNRADVERELENIDKDKDNDADEEEEDAAGSGRKGLTMGSHVLTNSLTQDANSITNENITTEIDSVNETADQNSLDKESIDNTVDRKENIANDTEPDNESTNDIEAQPSQTEDQEKNLDEEETETENKNEFDKKTKTEDSSTIDDVGAVEEADEDDEEDDEISNNESRSYISEKDDDKDDIEISLWKSLTAKLRADICIKRSDYFKDGLLNKETMAYLKDPKKMKTFHEIFDEFVIQKNEELTRKHKEQQSMMKNGFGTLIKQEDGENIPLVSNDDFNEDIIEREFNDFEVDNESFLKEYNIMNSMPTQLFQGISSKRLDKEENAIVQNILNESQHKPSVYMNNIKIGMSEKINENISLIQQIRHICHKISLIRLLQISAYNQNKSTAQDTLNSHIYKTNSIDNAFDLDPVSQLNTHDYKLNKDLITTIMHKSVSKVAMANGFESSQPNASAILSEIAGDYLSSLMKTMKIHKESNSLNQKTDNEILHLSLLENGISKPDDLYVYIDTEFVKKKKKLTDLKAKLETFLKELLRPTLQELSERNFDDQSQSFVTGDFASDLTGEDYFGFRELGLEREFGVLSSSVPLQFLTFQSNSSSIEAAVKVKKIQPDELDYHYKKVTKENIDDSSYTDLLKPLLKKSYDRTIEFHQKVAKLNSNNPTTEEIPEPHLELQAGTILEDDKMILKNKPGSKVRVPPTGKLTTTYKKKQVANAFFLPEVEESEKHLTDPSNGNGIHILNDDLFSDDADKTSNSSKEFSEYPSAHNNDDSELEKLFGGDDDNPLQSLKE